MNHFAFNDTYNELLTRCFVG